MTRAVRAGLKACATFVTAVTLRVSVAQAVTAVATLTLLVVAQPFRAALVQQNPNAVANFVKVQSPVVALTHVRVVDGTGADARENQTIVIRDGNIAELGGATRLTPPAGATVVDLTGKSVLPGLVMMHEHLYYTTGPGVYGQLGASFSRLYLAGGVTTMWTAGNVNGIMDINLSRRIAAGELPGPAIDVGEAAGVQRRARHLPEPTSGHEPVTRSTGARSSLIEAIAREY